MLWLTLLAPDIVESILDQRALAIAALSDLLQPFRAEWSLQRKKMGCVKHYT